MDLLVELVILQPVAGLVALDHLVVQRTHFGNARVACRLAGELAGELLQRLQDRQHVMYVLGAEALDDGAPARDELHQSFARQVLDGFAQWRARHAQLFAELAFVQAGAGR
ncbi:hypothetical protein D9M72_631290 [compost metagenome]